MVFDLRNPASPCYACLFPEDAEVEEVQCSTMGVFAPLTGVIGAHAGDGRAQARRRHRRAIEQTLQILDAKTRRVAQVRVKKDPACKVCSKP